MMFPPLAKAQERYKARKRILANSATVVPERANGANLWLAR